MTTLKDETSEAGLVSQVDLHPGATFQVWWLAVKGKIMRIEWDVKSFFGDMVVSIVMVLPP